MLIGSQPQLETNSGGPVVLHMRVVTGAGGGPDKTILNSPRLLTPFGIRAICGYMHPPHDPGFAELQRRALDLSAELVSVPDRGPWDPRVISRALKICKTQRVTIWHGHDYKSNALGLILRRYWPMRLVTTVHGWVTKTLKTPLYYWIDRICLPHYEQVVCVSQDLLDRCLQAGVPPDRCTLIENGIDTEQYRRRCPPEVAKARMGFRTDWPLIGAVGRLEGEKDFGLLVQAAAALLDQGLRINVVIAGDGSQRARLQQQIDCTGHPDNIQLIGHRSDLLDLYQAMDLFVLSSRREGLPNVLLEAMAMETPVVATRVGGVPQVIEDGVNGLLVEPGDSHALQAALYELLTNQGLRQEFQSRGRQTVEQCFSFSKRMDRIRNVYDRVIGQHASAN